YLQLPLHGQAKNPFVQGLNQIIGLSTPTREAMDMPQILRRAMTAASEHATMGESALPPMKSIPFYKPGFPGPSIRCGTARTYAMPM
ncbi:hypothetical protein, partial [Xanthomonas hortorum]|uniref:hypothetical protein n=1 Tax=Xanthomonas hortorum TaxID=56454 RepID=UPI0021577B3E